MQVWSSLKTFLIVRREWYLVPQNPKTRFVLKVCQTTSRERMRFRSSFCFKYLLVIGWEHVICLAFDMLSSAQLKKTKEVMNIYGTKIERDRDSIFLLYLKERIQCRCTERRSLKKFTSHVEGASRIFFVLILLLLLLFLFQKKLFVVSIFLVKQYAHCGYPTYEPMVTTKVSEVVNYAKIWNIVKYNL